MSRNTFYMILGVMIILIPFSGFPSFWKTTFHVVIGLIMIGLGMLIYLNKRARRSTEEFVENRKQ